MAEKLTHITVTEVILLLAANAIQTLICLYTPATGQADVPRLAGRMDIGAHEIDSALHARISRLIDVVRNLAGVEEYEIQGSTVEVPPRMSQIRLYPPNRELVIYFDSATDRRSFGELSEALRRLISSILSSITATCWADIHRRVGMPWDKGHQPQVLISYRHGHEKFAEALANRLGQEGLIPWFDRWDVRAGDSLVGKIEDAFANSVAFIPILTSDYQEGSWATEELRTAISKRIEEGFRIVPILLEHCERPELLKQLVYVDMTDQDPQSFEEKIAEIVDGIFALEANPFRGN